MNAGTRSTVRVSQPSRPGNGTSRSWARNIGDYRYSFTLVDMPDGEIRWFVRRYDTPIDKYGSEDSVSPESLRMRFDCYWERHREWTFRPPAGTRSVAIPRDMDAARDEAYAEMCTDLAGRNLKTADGFKIAHGMRVWDYNLNRATVDLSVIDDGWFYTIDDSGHRGSSDSVRVCVRHPFTGESA